jgi:YHS domain-containing protein
MKSLVQTLTFLSFIASLSTALAGASVNVDKNGVGIQGYDPVAFFTDGKPVTGKEEFHSSYLNVVYHFASAEHKAKFDANPSQYEPQFGGYCAYGVTKGHLAPVKIDAFQIVNGRLLMQYDSKVRETFNKDQRGNLELADKNWPGLSNKGH